MSNYERETLEADASEAREEVERLRAENAALLAERGELRQENVYQRAHREDNARGRDAYCRKWRAEQAKNRGLLAVVEAAKRLLDWGEVTLAQDPRVWELRRDLKAAVDALAPRVEPQPEETTGA